MCTGIFFSPHAQRPEIVEDSQELILQMVVSYLVVVGNRTLSSKKELLAGSYFSSPNPYFQCGCFVCLKIPCMLVSVLCDFRWPSLLWKTSGTQFT